MGTEPEGRGWGTVPTQRLVVIAVHTLTSWLWLDLVTALLEGDRRLQLVYTQVPDQLGDGVDRLLADRGVPTVPWSGIAKVAADLAIGGSLHQLEAIPARRRLAGPHGAGYSKRVPAKGHPGPASERPVYGVDPQSLTDRDGRPIVDAVILSHHDQLPLLVRQCPGAEPIHVVAGDLFYDSLLASNYLRPRLRRELNVREKQVLVALASTWGPESLAAGNWDLMARAMSELPANHRLVATLHPGIWAHHGRRAVIGWMHEARDAGMDLVEAGPDWRALLVASDVIVSDHTSISLYAAALGRPLLVSRFAEDELDPESALAELLRLSPQLCPKTPLPDQLNAARLAQPEQYEVAARRVSSMRGIAASVVRRTIYRLLDLPEPTDTPPRVNTAPLPRLVRDHLYF